jgi:hypothetical protein
VLCAALSPTAWVVDDTGFPKDGTCSVGVQRQYSGTLGKTANCQLGVSVTAVTEHASCPLDWRRFLPQRWDEDAMATRRAACHLPEQVHHRPKWQLVLDMLDELAGWQLSPPVLLADPGYGEVGRFRGGLDARQVPYVVEVRADTSAYPEQVRPSVAPHKGRGRRPRPRYRDQPSSLTELVLATGQQACVELTWRRGSKGLQRGRFLRLRVRPAGVTPRRLARADGGELPVRWLLAEWPRGKPEPTKYWLANLPETTHWWSWSAWLGCAGGWSRTIASSRAPWGWTISRGAAGPAGTTTSRWSRSRTGFLPWSGCVAQNRRRRPDPLAAAGRAAGPACLLGRRLSGVQASRTTVATPNGTTTHPDLTESY